MLLVEQKLYSIVVSVGMKTKNIIFWFLPAGNLFLNAKHLNCCAWVLITQVIKNWKNQKTFIMTLSDDNLVIIIFGTFSVEF